jgi:hypothetical protein
MKTNWILHHSTDPKKISVTTIYIRKTAITYSLCELRIHHEVVNVLFGARQFQFSRNDSNQQSSTTGALWRGRKKKSTHREHEIKHEYVCLRCLKSESEERAENEEGIFKFYDDKNIFPSSSLSFPSLARSVAMGKNPGSLMRHDDRWEFPSSVY